MKLSTLLAGASLALFSLPAAAETVYLTAGKLVEVQMSAEGATFNRAQMDRLLDLAEAGIAELNRVQREAVA